MGRRKIEIQPITQDRNRQVTFLKRKNGLFKKAYELGVLCSVDVAVIIFEDRADHQSKLYQYCSTDVRDMVQRHIRHNGEKDSKGPGDFSGAPSNKDDRDDDEAEGDDDDDFVPVAKGTKRRADGKTKSPVAEPSDKDYVQRSMAIPSPPMTAPISSDRRSTFNDQQGMNSNKKPRLLSRLQISPSDHLDESNYPFQPPGSTTGFRPPGQQSFGTLFGNGQPFYENFPSRAGPNSRSSSVGPGYPPFEAFQMMQQQAQFPGGIEAADLFAMGVPERRGDAIDWPSHGQGQPMPGLPNQNTSQDWLDFLSGANGFNTGGLQPNSKGSVTGHSSESWERSAGGRQRNHESEDSINEIAAAFERRVESPLSSDKEKPGKPVGKTRKAAPSRRPKVADKDG
ncbi:hypothetical protein C8J56DRAFT_227771 [Mycena floridula]|nr:hypothetical protein C8J56DRAFT_227771 [Mycena floridula]